MRRVPSTIAVLVNGSLSHRSKIRSSNQFSASYTATTVFFPPGGRPLMLYGPFEGTGVIGGEALIEVADLDEALQLT